MRLLLLFGCTAPPDTSPVDLTADAQLSLDGFTLAESLHLSTRSVGGAPFEPEAVGSDGTLAGPGVTESWAPQGDGWEQGWVVEAPPEAGPLVVEVDVGDARMSAWPTGAGAELRAADGTRWFYTDAAAWGADGVQLDAWIEAAPDTLRVVVDTADAVWPVTIDPVVHSAASTFYGGTASAYLGQAVAGGDVNGDGYADLVVSAYRLSTRGAVYVYLGGASGLPTTPSSTLWPATSGYDGYFGYALAVGDFDGNGYDDVAVGEPYYGNGTVYVFPGSATGVSSTATSTFAGSTTNEHLGSAMAAGDFDHDGKDDLVVATRYRSIYGAADVHLGTSSGLATTVTSTLSGGSGQYFGYSVASAGDVNADGYADAVLSDYQAGSYYGRAWVARGGSGGLSTSRLTTLTGPVYDTYFGRAAAGLGDVDGDGYDDVGVGAIGDDTSGSDAGAVYVYRGSSSGTLSTGYTTLYGSAGGDKFGASLAPLGDLDADGYDDAVIGAWYARGKTYSNGVAYVYQGAAGSLSGAADDSLSEGTTAYQLYGAALAGLGDVNGDGHPDLAVGQPEYASGGTAAGAVYVYYGGADDDGDGWSTGGTSYDCDDDDPAVNPDATEVCNGVDDDCDGTIDDGVSTTYYRDADGDGFGATPTTACSLPSGYVTVAGDCDDAAATSHPGASETVGDGVDQDCDGADLCWVDADHDGYGSSATAACAASGTTTVAGDCDDTSATIHPDATEVPVDGVDQDCSGADTCYVDGDRDGYGSTTLAECASVGTSTLATDCSDTDRTIHPGAAEVEADGIDQDCSGGDTCWADLDGDGYGTATAATSTDLDCTDAGESVVTTDCDDTTTSVRPGAPEVVADGVDQDCDGVDLCWRDGDGDGVGGTGTVACDTTDAVRIDGDCDDAAATTSPGAAEVVADGVDEDCDGGELCWLDLDGDTWGGTDTVASADLDCIDDRESGLGTDCDDRDADVNPGEAELLADGIDQDCSGADRCFVDADADGYGGTTTAECGAGTATNAADCDDGAAAAFPGAPEVAADGIDQDCDGGDTCWLDLDLDGHGSIIPTASADLDCFDAGEASDSGDCDDFDATVYGGATEVVGDGIDQDCSGADLCYVDADGDGFGTDTPAECGTGTAPVAGDCDDTLPDVHPGASDTPADGLDQDCSGADLCFVDADGDGQGGAGTAECGSGTATVDGDCDDANAAVYAGAPDLPADGVDADCDGTELCFVDADGDGWGTTDTTPSFDLGCVDVGLASASGDCDDTTAAVSPGVDEVPADGVDEDCDGDELCFVDGDGDGHGGEGTVVSSEPSCAEAGVAATDDDCDDAAGTVYPGAAEVAADAVDQDCDGGDACWADLDGDGFGGAETVASPNLSCDEGGEATTSTDCDDADLVVYPGAAEACNGVDDNCDGEVDEGVAECGDTGKIAAGGGCGGCASTGGTAAAWASFGLGLLALRRRQVSGTHK